MVHLDDPSQAVSSSLEISDWGELRPQWCFRSTGMAVSVKNCQALLLQREPWLIPMSFQELWSRRSEGSVLPWKVYSVQMLWGEQGWTIKEKDIPS